MLSVSEQVSLEIQQGLKSMGLSALSSKNTASLTGQLQNIAKKENRVRTIVGKSLMVVVGRDGKNLEGAQVASTLKVSYRTI